MRLIRSIERLEEARSGRPRNRGRAWGVVWTDSEELLAGGLARDERLAVDLHVVEEFEGVRLVRLVERATRERGDLGRVYAMDGSVVGRVVDLEDSLVTVSWLVSGAEAAAPVSPVA